MNKIKGLKMPNMKFYKESMRSRKAIFNINDMIKVIRSLTLVLIEKTL